MVQDYNNGKESNELACLPLAWLRDVWRRRQRNIQLAVLGTWRTWACVMWRLIGRRNTSRSSPAQAPSRIVKRRRQVTQPQRRPTTRSSQRHDLPPSARTRSKNTAKRNCRHPPYTAYAYHRLLRLETYRSADPQCASLSSATNVDDCYRLDSRRVNGSVSPQEILVGMACTLSEARIQQEH